MDEINHILQSFVKVRGKEMNMMYGFPGTLDELVMVIADG